MSAEQDVVPEGYVPHVRTSPVTDPWQPLFAKIAEGKVQPGASYPPRPLQRQRLPAWRVISALADNAMGLSIIETLHQRGIARGRGGSTVSLALDFLLSAQIGQWVEFSPRVLKIGAGIGFADCLILAESQIIARGNATYRFYEDAKGGLASH
jgi:acyl-coenzyme A thioesterase PaaI-like protein